MKQPNPDWEDEDQPCRVAAAHCSGVSGQARGTAGMILDDDPPPDKPADKKDEEDYGVTVRVRGSVWDDVDQPCKIVERTNDLPALLDLAELALEKASTDLERLRVRDEAKALAAAAAIIKRQDIQVKFAAIVLKAERAIAKANPPKQGDRTDLTPQGEATESNLLPQGNKLKPSTLTKIRKSQPEDDEVFDRIVTAAVEKGKPLTRADLKRAKDKIEKKAAQEQETKAALEAAQERQDEPGDVHACSCRELIAKVEADSLDAVFTDPPYAKDFLPAWDELAEFAMHGLKPGGLLLALSGQLCLPEIMRKFLDAGLQYRWTVGYIYCKPRGKIHAAKVSVGWKPCLAFRKPGGSPPDHYSEDAFMAVPKSGADKADHEWGQTEKDMQAIAREWLRPGWNVCDPFCGAGALLSAAKSIGCKVSGCDIEADHVAKTLAKLASCEIDTGGQASHANEEIEALADAHIVRGFDSPADETGGLDEGYRQFATKPKLDLIAMIRARDKRIDELVREVRALMERKAA